MRYGAACAVISLACLAARSAEPDWLSQPALNEQHREAPPGARPGKGPPKEAGGPNLIRNGDFENGSGTQPAGWSLLDRLTTTWVPGGPTGKGKCLRIDTDVYLSEWQANKRAVAEGGPGIARTTPTSGPKYDTVAGTHGIHVFSDEIRVERDEAFMLSVSMKGPSETLFFPKVFVKGYRYVKGEWEEVWRGPLHCRTSPDTWRRFEWRYPKTPSKYGAQKVKVILYCYWPPGVYHIDDVEFRKVDPAGYRPRPGPAAPRDIPPPQKRETPPPEGEPVKY